MNPGRRRFFIPIAAGVLGLAGCSDSPPPPAPPAVEAHRAAIEAWSENRIASLLQPVGWLSLSGLHWIESGRTSFGADTANDYVYDPPGRTVPPRIGTFNRTGSTVTFEAEPGVHVRVGQDTVTRVVMRSGAEPTLLNLDALVWRIIERGDRIAVRLWDTASAVRTDFRGIERFPVRLDWRFPARFIVTDPPDTIDVPNVLGTVNRTPSPASVEFEFEGTSYRLMLWKDSDDPANFFTAFADRTNGNLTYGGGRFLWIDAPDADGWTVVDFNRAYNPPCVFTAFATCPLAPRPNRLPFAIEAGERSFKADD